LDLTQGYQLLALKPQIRQNLRMDIISHQKGFLTQSLTGVGLVEKTAIVILERWIMDEIR